MRRVTIIIGLLTCLWSCKSNSQKDLNSAIDDYRSEILGEWVLENDVTTKLEFFDTGKVNFYEEGQLVRNENYLITVSCDGETISDGGLFLKLFKSESDVFCSYIEGINFNNNGLMSLMTKNQGKIIVYKRP